MFWGLGLRGDWMFGFGFEGLEIGFYRVWDQSLGFEVWASGLQGSRAIQACPFSYASSSVLSEVATRNIRSWTLCRLLGNAMPSKRWLNL